MQTRCLLSLRHFAWLAVAPLLLAATNVDAGGLPRKDKETAPTDSVAVPVAPDSVTATDATQITPDAQDTAAADTLATAPDAAAADTLTIAPDSTTTPSHPATLAIPAIPAIPAVDAIISVQDFGEFTIRVFVDEAPQHVAAFLNLAGSGVYDSLGFHRIIPGFLIQTGDPTSRDEDRENDGQTAPSWRIPEEPSARSHVRGTVSLAWQGDDAGSAGAQWFVTIADAPQLDGRATPIGEVVAGMDVVDRISQVSTLRNRHPLRPVRLGNVRLVASPADSRAVDANAVAPNGLDSSAVAPNGGDSNAEDASSGS